MKRILITCIGGYYTYQVVSSIRKVKKLSKFILGVDVNPNVNAFFVDKFEAVPRADLSKSKYIKKIIYLCKKHKIDTVIPLSENETLAISKYINFFEKHKIKTSVSSFETVNLMTDKLKMFEYLNNSGVDVGKWRKIDNFNDAINALNFFEYPSKKVVIKPRFSSGSRGILIINRKKNSFVKLLSDRFCGEGSWEIIKEELKNSGKSDNIIEKISKGKLEKFKQENTLINQIWIMDPKKKVKDVIAELGKENSITIKDFVRYKVGE